MWSGSTSPKGCCLTALFSWDDSDRQFIQWLKPVVEVLRHENMSRVLYHIAHQPAALVLINCSAGNHRAATVVAWLYGFLLVLWRLLLLMSDLLIHWLNDGPLHAMNLAFRNIMWRLSPASLASGGYGHGIWRCVGGGFTKMWPGSLAVKHAVKGADCHSVRLTII